MRLKTAIILAISAALTLPAMAETPEIVEKKTQEKKTEVKAPEKKAEAKTPVKKTEAKAPVKKTEAKAPVKKTEAKAPVKKVTKSTEKKTEPKKIVKKEEDKNLSKKVESKKIEVKKTEAKHSEIKLETVDHAPTFVPGEWSISVVEGDTVKGDERPYLTFDPLVKRFYGNNGCNTINGDYRLEGNNKIELSNVISTMRLCPDAPYQDKINAALVKAHKYGITHRGHETYMTIQSSQGATVMVLRKHNMDFANGAWKVTELNGSKERVDSAALELVIDINELKMHGKTGCNIVNGELLIDPDKKDALQFLNLAMTQRMCHNSDLETEYVLALEQVDHAKIEDPKHPDVVALLDQDGNKIIELTRLYYKK